jgi:hypothetical protein
VFEARGFFSRLSGDAQAIRTLQTDPVHYFQRPDASHLEVQEDATSLFGHGASLRFGRSAHGRLRISDHFRWYAPGLEFNDLGYLRQADDIANRFLVGWDESVPRHLFRRYAVQATREDHWDFGGLHTLARTAVEGSGQFANKWEAVLELAYEDLVDTRMLRGGPALRWHDFFTVFGRLSTDPSRRVRASASGEYSPARDDDSRLWSVEGDIGVRVFNRLSLSGAVYYETLLDNLQYAATAETDMDPRWVLGRLDQDTWSFTFRMDLSVTPDLTVQYYGSPFISTGRYTAYKRATDPLAEVNADRFHLYASDEIAYDPDENGYEVTEAGGGPSFVFANPDFSFREFRSNLVVRWEWKPGSSLYVVWSQGRTGFEPSWDSSLGSNWDALWQAEPDNTFLVKLSYWFSP